jgi:hypothetical protein
MPDVWARAGHDEITWCNQFLKRLAILLLTLVERRPPDDALFPEGPPAAAGGGGLDAAAGAGVDEGSTEGGARRGEGLGSFLQPTAFRPEGRRRWQQRRGPWRGGSPRKVSDAALLELYLQGRVAHSLASTPLSRAAAQTAAAALRRHHGSADITSANATAAAAGGLVSAVFAGPWTGPNADVGPRACRNTKPLSWHAAMLRGVIVGAPSRLIHGSQLDDGRGNLFSWDVGRFLGGGGGRGGLLLVASAAKPCDGFRLWLELDRGAGAEAAAAAEEAARQERELAILEGRGDDGGSGSSSSGGGSSIDLAGVELSHLAAPLPLIDSEASITVKHPK